MTRNRGVLVALVVSMALVAGAVIAADYPTKPVQLMVAYPAGGSTDVAARILASVAEKDLGQSLVVVNKPGAGGQVGWTEMARQRPDGHYIGLINLPALNTVILDPERKAVFGIDAFTPIINHVLDPGVIWVKADSPYKSLKELTAAAQKDPGKISAATTGILSDDHLAILMVEEAVPGAQFRLLVPVGRPPLVELVVVEVVLDQAEEAAVVDGVEDLVQEAAADGDEVLEKARSPRPVVTALRPTPA